MFVEGKPKRTKEPREASLDCEGEKNDEGDDADVNGMENNEVQDDGIEEEEGVENKVAGKEVDVDVGREGKGGRMETELDTRKVLRRSKCMQKPSYKLIQSSSLAATVVLQSYQQAINSSNHVHWQNTMLYEYDKIVEHDVAVEVDQPSKQNVIKGRWVYNTKTSPNNKVKYRARYVGKEFSEVYSIEFTDTFAPVAHIASLRLILALAATNN